MIDHHAKTVRDYSDYFFIINNDSDTFHIYDRILNNKEDKNIKQAMYV